MLQVSQTTLEKSSSYSKPTLFSPNASHFVKGHIISAHSENFFYDFFLKFEIVSLTEIILPFKQEMQIEVFWDTKMRNFHKTF